MEFRVEPRFEVASPIRVFLPGTPTKVLDCRLIDISATGMRFLSNVPVEGESIVSIEVDDRMVLSEIRHCNSYGDKFVSGVRRLHEVPKSSLTCDPSEYLTELVEDLRRRVYAGDEAESRVLALQAFELIVEKANRVPTVAQPETDTWTEPAPQSPPPVQQQTPIPPPIARIAPLPPADGEPADAPAPKHRAQTSWRMLLALAAGLVLASVVALNVMQHRSAAKMTAKAQVPVPAPAATTEVASTAAPQPAPEPTPEPAPDKSPAPVATPAPPAPSPAAAVPHVAAASTPPPVAVAKAPAPPVSKPLAPAPLKPPPLNPLATPQGVHRTRLMIHESSWVSVQSDGTSVLAKTMQKGEVQEFEFSNKALLHLGNAGAVEMVVDGKPVGSLPGRRPLRVIEVTPDGVRSLPWFNEVPEPASRPVPLRAQ